MNKYYLGVDIGSISLKMAVIDEHENLIFKSYARTQGEPVTTLKEGLRRLQDMLREDGAIANVVTTGSGRKLIGEILGASMIKNEIITHAFAAMKEIPEVRTIIDIGGQDSKLILIQDKILKDFSMNTLCAAGTGSFLEQQSQRLAVAISQFGHLALKADKVVNISGRCTIFAESDMISLQQTGEKKTNIIKGLCMSLVKNYLSNLSHGKSILEPILFHGGVASNIGIVKSFEEVLNKSIHVPENHMIMGAYGSALLARRYEKENVNIKFRGFQILAKEYTTNKEVCEMCANSCNIIQVLENDIPLAYWGDRCGKWSHNSSNKKKVCGSPAHV